MRNTFLLIGLTVFFVSCGKQKRADIHGTLAGINNDTLLLEQITTLDKKIVDTVVTGKKGDFRFKVDMPGTTPTFYNIIYKNSQIPLLVSPGDRIKVNSLGDLASNYTVEGSDDSQLIKEFNTLFRSGVKTLDSLSALYSSTLPTPEYDERRKELIAAYTQAYIKIKREHIKFIVTHATSIASIYALYQRLPNDDALFNPSDDRMYYRLVADSLASRYAESGHVKALLRDLERQDNAVELANKILEAANDTRSFPDIHLLDTEDRSQQLSSLEGKVILLDFWVVDDARSNILNAELKELYQQYHENGLEVFQVSVGDNKAAWMSAVQTQRLPWISVLEPNGLAGLSARTYQITDVPSNVLIDREGNIVAHNVYGTDLKNRLSTLFK